MQNTDFPSMADLLLQPNASHKILKARIRAKFVPPRINFNERDLHFAILAGLYLLNNPTASADPAVEIIQRRPPLTTPDGKGTGELSTSITFDPSARRRALKLRDLLKLSR